jgi:hypothetical protein
MRFRLFCFYLFIFSVAACFLLAGNLSILEKTWYKQERLDKLAGKTVDIYQDWLCDKLFPKLNARPKLLLDHGAGPFTNLGNRLRCPSLSVDAQVVSVDPLSPAYNRILNMHNIHSTTRSFPCKSEDLDKCFCPDTFDFSIIINALDHSEDAVLGLMNAALVTKSQGLVCFVTLKNEARLMQQRLPSVELPREPC